MKILTCPTCNNEIDAEDNFCRHCGMPLKQNVTVTLCNANKNVAMQNENVAMQNESVVLIRCRNCMKNIVYRGQMYCPNCGNLLINI